MIELLKKNKNKWYTTKEISKLIGISHGSVTTSLMKLRQSQLIDYRSTGFRNQLEYRFKQEERQ